MKLLNPLNRECRIGVLGFGMSGKTVFLTSLLNHIKYHRREEFSFPKDAKGNVCEIRGVNVRTPKLSPPWREFPYAVYRGTLGNTENHDWPTRTIDCSRTTIDFRVEGWQTNYSLTFFDIPGERVGDIAMLGNDYRTWSLSQMNWLITTHAKRPQTAIREFLDVADNAPTDKSADELVEFYKRAMISIAVDAGNNITPSTFLLDNAGKRFLDKHKTVSDLSVLSPAYYARLLPQCTSGLQGKELAPLGQLWFQQKGQPCVEKFQKNYKAYNDEIVTPLFGTLISCDALAVLIDIPYILEYRYPASHNDTVSFLDDIFRGLKPDNRYLPWLLSAGQRRRIKRVAFIASQCDRFHCDDWDKLEKMTFELARTPLRNNLYVTGESFCCSSVISTGRVDSGILSAKHPDETVYPFKSFRIPDAWNRGWPADNQWKSYLEKNGGEPPEIHQVAPCYPSVLSDVPRQYNLDAILQFLTGWGAK